jgi:DNA replication protein DnaC
MVMVETKYSNGHAYAYSAPCTVCDTEWRLHRAFGALSSDKASALSTKEALLDKIKEKPEKTENSENVRSALRELVIDPHNAASVIVIGPPGTGKTFLGAHALKAIMEKHKRPALFLPEHVFLKAWRATHDTVNLAEQKWGLNLIEAARNCAILMIDDFGQTRSTSAGGVDALEALIMHRYDAKLNVIITTNRSVDGLRNARGDRVVSRLAGLSKGMFVNLMGDDWRLAENG